MECAMDMNMKQLVDTGCMLLYRHFMTCCSTSWRNVESMGSLLSISSHSLRPMNTAVTSTFSSISKTLLAQSKIKCFRVLKLDS